MDDKFFKEVLEENKDAVKRKVREAMLEGIERQFSWELPQAVKNEVSKFVEEEIVPSVRADLMENKDAMVNAATEIVASVPAELAKAMQEQLAKTLKDSWKLRKVTEALFQ